MTPKYANALFQQNIKKIEKSYQSPYTGVKLGNKT